MSLKRPFALGKLNLSSNIFYAPLAGCSDYPFRMMSALYKPGLMFCEMVKMEPLVRNDSYTMRMLDFDKSMHPIGGQICGSKPALAGPSARIIQDLGFDVVDLNCGCPVDKVTKDGSGSGMLKNPELIGEVISNMVAAVSIPVTVKIRAGWDENTINAPLITQIAEQAGAVAICIHGRTRQQAYKGPANWDYIKACKEVAKNIVVIGNGDVTSGEAAEKIFSHTACDAVLVSRGTLGQPWIVEDILRHLSKESNLERGIDDYKKALLQHFQFVKGYHHERRTIIDMRRVGCWYIKRTWGTRAFREFISKAHSVDEIEKLITTFPFEECRAESEQDESTEDGE